MSGEDTRVAILEAATKLAAKHGMRAVTMADVAKAAGVSRQSVYLHFDGRGPLIAEMMRQRVLQHPLAQVARRLSTAPASVEKFEAFIGANIRYMLSVTGPMTMGLAASFEDKAVQDALRVRMSTGTAMIHQMMEDLHRQGLLRAGWTPQEASEWLNAQVTSTSLHTLRVLMGWPVERIIERMVSMLRRELIKG